MKYDLPDLPENERWSLSESFGSFTILRRQRKRWWGWRTVAKYTMGRNPSGAAFRRGINACMRPEYYERLLDGNACRTEREDRRRWGVGEGGEVMNLVEKVRALAAESPDRVAADYYVLGGKPECIIGHAMAASGWPVAALEASEGEGVLILSMEGLLPGVSEAEVDWLYQVQQAQDAGHTWAEAVELADKERGAVQ